MKTATVRQVQHHLRTLLAWVAEGETVEVTRNREVVARIVPPPRGDAVLPDFLARLGQARRKRAGGTPLSQIIDEQRGPRP